MHKQQDFSKRTRTLAVEPIEERTVLSAGNEFAFLIEPISFEDLSKRYAEVAAAFPHVDGEADVQVFRNALLAATQPVQQGWAVDADVFFEQLAKHPSINQIIELRTGAGGGLLHDAFDRAWPTEGIPIHDQMGSDVSIFLDEAVERSASELESGLESQSSLVPPGDSASRDVFDRLTAQLGAADQRLDLKPFSATEFAPTLVTVSDNRFAPQEESPAAPPGEFVPFVPPESDGLLPPAEPQEDVVAEEAAVEMENARRQDPAAANLEFDLSDFLLNREAAFRASLNAVHDRLSPHSQTPSSVKTEQTEGAEENSEGADLLRSTSDHPVVEMKPADAADQASLAPFQETALEPDVTAETLEDSEAGEGRYELTTPSVIAAGIAAAMRWARRVLR